MKTTRQPRVAAVHPALPFLVLFGFLVLVFLVTSTHYQLRVRNGETEVELRPAEPLKATQPQDQLDTPHPLQPLSP